jgi:uncharacterized membrane protein YphA (DoxX/SURF4 family)
VPDKVQGPQQDTECVWKVGYELYTDNCPPVAESQITGRASIMKAASLLTELERQYAELRGNKWLRYFAVFSRIALALGFLPSGFVKVRGERFTGLPSNHPLGHYFDALYVTGSYYTFIGVGQLISAVLLLIPRTALLGAIFYFPIILNISVLTYSVRFEGTRIATLMLMANLFLLAWDYPRLKYILPFSRHEDPHVAETEKFPVLFFAFVFAMALSVIVINMFIFDIRPGNSEIECTNGCGNSSSPNACRHFCDCVYKEGNALNVCLNEYHQPR